MPDTVLNTVHILSDGSLQQPNMVSITVTISERG